MNLFFCFPVRFGEVDLFLHIAVDLWNENLKKKKKNWNEEVKLKFKTPTEKLKSREKPELFSFKKLKTKQKLKLIFIVALEYFVTIFEKVDRPVNFSKSVLQ